MITRQEVHGWSGPLWQRLHAAAKGSEKRASLSLATGTMELDVVCAESLACLLRQVDFYPANASVDLGNAAKGGGQTITSPKSLPLERDWAQRQIDHLNRILPALDLIEFDEPSRAFLARTRSDSLEQSTDGCSYFEVIGNVDRISLVRFHKPSHGSRRRIEFALTRAAIESLVDGFSEYSYLAACSSRTATAGDARSFDTCRIDGRVDSL